MYSVFVVYITFYRGNRLPPFYIGKTTGSRILKGYNGSVRSDRYKAIWRQERREHPELFRTVILSRFETDEEALSREEFLQRFFDVPNNPMFINMGIANKGFGAAGLKSEEHKLKLRKPHSEEHNQKMRDALKGRTLSETHRLNIGISNIGKHFKRFSSEVKEHMRNAALKRSILTCPHCGSSGKGGIMYRWHFDNCRRALVLNTLRLWSVTLVIGASRHGNGRVSIIHVLQLTGSPRRSNPGMGASSLTDRVSSFLSFTFRHRGSWSFYRWTVIKMPPIHDSPFT